VKVSSTELPPRQVSLAIEVEQERLDRAIDEAFRRLAGRVDVPGFRRGRAPRPMVERIIGRDRIVEDALEQLVPQVVNEAIEQEKVDPYTRPRVESIEFDPLRVKATVGLAPKVELGDYQRGLRVPAQSPNVAADEVDQVIQRLRESHAQWVPVERPVRLGDRVGLDVHAEVEGRERPLVESHDAEYVVEPEGAQPAPGFAEQLIGLAAGASQQFVLELPADFREAEVAGQPATFSVELHWVKERQLPELDDEFAQQMGEFSDLAALRSAVEEQLRQREEERVRQELEDAAMNKLVEISLIEYPPQLVEHQAQHMLESFTRNVEQQGLQLGQYLRLIGKEQEAFEQEIRAEAESRVRRSLALDAFASAEQIGVERDEVEDEVRRAAESSDDAEAVQRLAMANPNTMQRVEEVARERKALARLIELATSGNGTATSGTSSKRKSSDTPAAAAAAAAAAEKATAEAETPDTESQTLDVPASVVEQEPEKA